MKLAFINAVAAGSTGSICRAIGDLLLARGDDYRLFYAIGQPAGEHSVRYADEASIRNASLLSHALGDYGFHNRKATEKLIALLDAYQPDLVHLHNLHSHNVELERLFSYFREKQIKVVWTFHDCWAFTGYCVHFDNVGCDKWKERCHACPQKRDYSFLFDRSEELFYRKRDLLAPLDLTVVTPSEWMASLVRQSFLKDKPVCVLPNGIDRAVFHPTESNFRARHGLQDKKIVLGVAYQWEYRKGLDVFEELSRRLPEDHKIVLVGTDDAVDAKLPAGILSIHRTQNPQELAELYSTADVFVNPTREDTFPTVNMEALACGTPVVTFRTGGSAECLTPDTGYAVEKNDVDGLLASILLVTQEGRFSRQNCLARAAHYDRETCFSRYLELYDDILGAR